MTMVKLAYVYSKVDFKWLEEELDKNKIGYERYAEKCIEDLLVENTNKAVDMLEKLGVISYNEKIQIKIKEPDKILIFRD